MHDAPHDIGLNPWCVFTSPEAVARVLDAIDWSEGRDLSEERLLEPAAGDGAFVTMAAQRLVRSMRARAIKPDYERMRDRILAREIHPGLAATLRARVAAALGEEGLPNEAAIELAHTWCQIGDFLSQSQTRRFTCVVGNPPFQRGGGSRPDVCVSFVEKSFRMLMPGGRLAMIAPLSLASAVGAAKLRQVIEQEGRVELVNVLRPERAFRTRVSVISGLFVVKKGRAPRARAREISAWLAGPEKVRKAFERISQSLPKLEEAGCRIKLGMATGANSVFTGLAEHLPVEQDLLVPAVDISDMPDGALEWRGKMVIATHRSDGSPWRCQERPALYRYLGNHRKTLEARATVKAGRSWRLTHTRLDHALAASPKLLVPEIGRRARVALDSGGMMPLNSIHAVISAEWPLAPLQAILGAAGVGLAMAAVNLQRGKGHLRLNATHLRLVRIPEWQTVGLRERRLLESGDARSARLAAARLFQLDEGLLELCAAVGWEA